MGMGEGWVEHLFKNVFSILIWSSGGKVTTVYWLYRARNFSFVKAGSKVCDLYPDFQKTCLNQNTDQPIVFIINWLSNAGFVIALAVSCQGLGDNRIEKNKSEVFWGAQIEAKKMNWILTVKWIESWLHQLQRLASYSSPKVGILLPWAPRFLFFGFSFLNFTSLALLFCLCWAVHV